MLVFESGAPHVALGAGSVSFQDAMADAEEPIAFHVSDSSLNTLGSGTATWTSIPEAVSQSAWWNLATGSPHSSVHSLTGSFDTGDPSSTPLAFDPLPTASVNGVATLVDNLNPVSGAVSLLNDVDAGSTLVVSFSFDRVDSYGSGSQRVRVTSASDSDGEWVGFSEVTSSTNSSPNASSGIFRGSITPSAAESADASGDGKVWVRAGDSLTITYFGSGGHTAHRFRPCRRTHTHAHTDSHKYPYQRAHTHAHSNQHADAHEHATPTTTTTSTPTPTQRHRVPPRPRRP